jgi:hypothetical protein
MSLPRECSGLMSIQSQSVGQLTREVGAPGPAVAVAGRADRRTFYFSRAERNIHTDRRRLVESRPPM